MSTTGQPVAAATFYERVAKGLRGFGPLGLVAIAAVVAGSLVDPALGAMVAVAWAVASGTGLRELGLRKPKRLVLSIVLGIAFGAALKLAMKSLVMPLFDAPAVNPRYHFLAGNTAALPSIVAAIVVSAGFGEEVVFRGYLFERLQRLFGTSAAARTGIVIFTSALFALAHVKGQGLPGAEQAAITGLVFGGLYALTGELWTVMIVHAAFDLMAVAIIYWDAEARIAHLFF
jgi:membrane protease YdiL (CAAX protease family)